MGNKNEYAILNINFDKNYSLYIKRDYVDFLTFYKKNPQVETIVIGSKKEKNPIKINVETGAAAPAFKWINKFFKGDGVDKLWLDFKIIENLCCDNDDLDVYRLTSTWAQKHKLNIDEPSILFSDQVQKLINVSAHDLDKMCQAGELPQPIKIAGQSAWPVSVIAEWIESISMSYGGTF